MFEHADVPLYRRPASAAVLMGLAALFMTAKPAPAQSALPATATPTTAAPTRAMPVEEDQRDVADQAVAVTRTETATKDEQAETDGKDAGKSSDSAAPAAKPPKDPTAQRDQDFRKQMGDLDRANRDQQRLQRELTRAQQQVQELSKRLAEASQRLAKLQIAASGIPAGQMPPATGFWMKGPGGAAMGIAPSPQLNTGIAPGAAPANKIPGRARFEVDRDGDRPMAAEDRRLDRIERQMDQLARALDQLRRDLHNNPDVAPKPPERQR